MDVLEVEQQARAAALLEDDKRLSKSKAFRDARTELGIKSARDGFGPGSRYVLELPDAPWAPLPKQGRLWMIGAPMERFDDGPSNCLRDHRADWLSSAPASRVGSGGLALFVQRGGVVALTDSTAGRPRP